MPIAQLGIDQIVDRRHAPRLDCNYPAQVRIRSSNGAKMDQDAMVSNLSASGLCLRFDKPVEPGSSLFTLVRVVEEPSDKYLPFSIASDGVVVRSVPQVDGKFGVAVRFNHRRLI